MCLCGRVYVRVAPFEAVCAAIDASDFGRVAEGEEEEHAASVLNLWGAATTANIGAVPLAASEAAVTAINETTVRIKDRLVVAAAATATLSREARCRRAPGCVVLCCWEGGSIMALV